MPAVRELMQGYVEALNRHNGARYSKISYAFAKFSDGTAIPILRASSSVSSAIS